MPAILRSILAVLAGAVLIVVLSMAADMAAVALGLFPRPPVRAPDGLFLEPFLYRSAIAVLGAWVTGRLAPSAPVRHALILGGIGVAASLLGAVMAGGKTGGGPVWYPWALVVTTLPLCWLGGVLARRQRGG